MVVQDRTSLEKLLHNQKPDRSTLRDTSTFKPGSPTRKEILMFLNQSTRRHHKILKRILRIFIQSQTLKNDEGKDSPPQKKVIVVPRLMEKDIMQLTSLMKRIVPNS